MPYTFKHGDRPIEGLTVQRAVGRGGFGEVYYAVTDSGKQVALKYLRENPDVELRGVGHVMNLKSPHLITIYDVRQNEAGEPFVIMEYVSGPSLRELLVNEPGGLGVQKAAFFLRGICKGLSYLHERGIVHRDLKPANIFYDDGYVKIGDYGLSKHMSVSKHSGQTVSVGTVHYMAPEIGSGSYTQAIDVYALGVILYEMLTGRLPYTGSSMAEILMRHLRDAPDLTGIPTPFARVIAKALEKDPNDRYPAADAMLADVMDSADVSASVDSFDATALTHVPRVQEALDPDRTQTVSPALPRAVPSPLDVRELAGREALPEPVQRRLNRFSRKLEQKVTKLEKRLGPRHGARPHGAAAVGRGPGGPHALSRKGHLFILLAVTVGVSIVLGLLYHGSSRHVDPPAAVPIAMCIVGAIVGALLTYFRFVSRSTLESGNVFHRLAYAAAAGLFLVPTYIIAVEEIRDRDLAAIVFGPVAALLLCDFTQRIEAGRAGRVSGGAAFWPAVIGLVATALGGGDDNVFIGAGVTAAVALLVQASAAMWPLRRVDPETGILGAQHSPLGERLRWAEAHRDVAPLAQGAAAPVQAAAYPADSAARAVEAAGASAGRTPVTAEPWPESHASASSARLDLPSFAGRTVSAGVSFIAKTLMLVGLVLTVAQRPAHLAYTRGIIDVDGPLHDLLKQPIPPGITLTPLLAGCLMLVVARRRGGGWVLVRTLVGCLLIFAGALFAMTLAADSICVLFTVGDTNRALDPGTWAPLVPGALGLGFGLLLLMWPRKNADRPIVV